MGYGIFKTPVFGTCVLTRLLQKRHFPKTLLCFLGSFMRFAELFHLKRSERGPACVGVSDDDASL